MAPGPIHALPFLIQLVLLTRTTLAQRPSNDLCSQAIPLTVNDPNAVTGSTVGSSEQRWCARPNNQWQGVWYSLEGTGNLMTVSTCSSQTDFASDVSVQTTCGSQCVDSVFFEPGCSVPKKGRSVAWRSVVGQRYRIFVSGRNQGETGKFGISAKDYTVPPNDLCTNAIELIPGERAVSGNTIASNFDTWCEASQGSFPSVYYKVRGTGELMSVSTCTSESDFLMALAVQGSCDGACLSQVDLNLPCKTKFGSVIGFQTILDQTYYITVTGSSRRDRGRFSIFATSYPTPINNQCAGAIRVGTNSRVIGSTVAASLNPWSCAGATSAPEWQSVYYSVAGTGGLITATTCSDTTNYKSAIAVTPNWCATGQCVAPVNVNLDCPFPNRASSYSWISNANLIYYIQVGGQKKRESGTFELTVRSWPTPNNDQCGQAEPLLIGDSKVIGTTAGATLKPWCSVGPGQWRGVWYSVVGDGGPLTVTTCNKETRLDIDVSVQTVCGGVEDTCVNTFRTQCTTPFGGAKYFNSQPGVTYYIFVTGKRVTDQGEFGIRVVQGTGTKAADTGLVKACVAQVKALCGCKQTNTCITKTTNKECKLSSTPSASKKERREVKRRADIYFTRTCADKKKKSG